MWVLVGPCISTSFFFFFFLAFVGELFFSLGKKLYLTNSPTNNSIQTPYTDSLYLLSPFHTQQPPPPAPSLLPTCQNIYFTLYPITAQTLPPPPPPLLLPPTSIPTQCLPQSQPPLLQTILLKNHSPNITTQTTPSNPSHPTHGKPSSPSLSPTLLALPCPPAKNLVFLYFSPIPHHMHYTKNTASPRQKRHPLTLPHAA